MLDLTVKLTAPMTKANGIPNSSIVAQGKAWFSLKIPIVGTFTALNQLMFPKSHTISKGLTSREPHGRPLKVKTF